MKESRCMSLLPRTTLHSDSEQILYNPVSLPIQLLPSLSKVAYRLFLGCLWQLLIQSSLPIWLPWKPSYLNRLKHDGSLGFSCGCCSGSPASPPWELPYLSRLSPGGPFAFHSAFPMRLPFWALALFQWQVLLILFFIFVIFCAVN